MGLVTIKSCNKLVLIIAEFGESIYDAYGRIDCNIESSNIADKVLRPIDLSKEHKCIFCHFNSHSQKHLLTLPIVPNERQDTSFIDLKEIILYLHRFETLNAHWDFSFKGVSNLSIACHLEHF